jgi:hypothetical protein
VGYPIDPVPFTQVKVADGFWGQRLKASREVTIPLARKGRAGSIPARGTSAPSVPKNRTLGAFDCVKAFFIQNIWFIL